MSRRTCTDRHEPSFGGSGGTEEGGEKTGFWMYNTHLFCTRIVRMGSRVAPGMPAEYQ